MDPDELRQQWFDLSGPWIEEARIGRNPTRTGLLDPAMLSLCGNVSGLRVLDCGCGEGRLCRIMVERGAGFALGVDSCPPMIEAARELQTNRDEYRVADAQDLSFLRPSTFDLALSCLNHCDLPEYEANIREVFRVLRPGGRFLVANLHPMRSASGMWQRDESGVKQHVIVDDYFDETERQWRMMGVDFTNFHRSLESQVNAFLGVGFRLERLMEPTITTDLAEAYPELADERRVPNFIVYAWLKP